MFPMSSLRSQWLPTNGHLGSIQTLAANGNDLYAGTMFGSAVYLTSDNGSNWTAIGTTLGGSIGATAISSLVVVGSTLFAGTGDGIYKTTNRGKSWSAVTTPLPANTTVNTFASLGSLVFAGTTEGVISSTNNGKNWKAVSTGLTNPNVTSLAAIGPAMYAGTYGGGVYMTADSGKSWKTFNSGLPDTTIVALASIGSTLFAGTYVWPYACGVFRSDGTSWTNVSSGLQPTIHELVTSGSNLFAGSDSGIFLTTNNGESWSAVSLGLTHGYATGALAVLGTNLFAGTFDTVWRRPLSEMITGSGVVVKSGSASGLRSYPNPFSNSTSITFHSEIREYAEISIVNLVGVEVAHVFSGMLEVGEHQWPWNPNTVIPDGSYACVIRMTGHITTLPILKQTH